jgi:hypothetical protein
VENDGSPLLTAKPDQSNNTHTYTHTHTNTAADPTSPGEEHAVLVLYTLGLLLEFCLLFIGTRLLLQLRRCHPLGL